jgi:hypothetical protein
MSERVYSGVTLENLTALVDRLQGGKECGNSTDPCNSMTTANAHRLGGNTSKANTTANERARAEGPRPLVENLVRRLEDRLTIRAITNCPLCDQMCPMVFPCTECDFLGCGNCYDDHKHSSDSDTSAERYRNQIRVTQPKEASGLGATVCASAGSYGESAPCTETAGGEKSSQYGPSVASPTNTGVNAGNDHPGDDCQSPGYKTELPKTSDGFGPRETVTSTDASERNSAAQCGVKQTLSPEVFGSPVSWDDEHQEEAPLPAGVIRFNRNHRVRKPEPKPKAVNIGCAKCDPFPCTCLPPAAKEVQ